MIPGSTLTKYHPKRMELGPSYAQITKTAIVSIIAPPDHASRRRHHARIRHDGHPIMPALTNSLFCPDYIMQTTTPDKRKIDKIIPFVIWTYDRRNFILFLWFFVQENPRSEPEVAEVSKNGLPFIRTVISTCHLGKKWGLMTKIGGGRNFENNGSEF